MAHFPHPVPAAEADAGCGIFFGLIPLDKRSKWCYNEKHL